MKVTANAKPITKQTIDGVDYFTTERGGVAYCAYFMAAAGEWFVSSRRIGLGRFNTGGGRYVADIAQHKAFAALPTLQKLGAI